MAETPNVPGPIIREKGGANQAKVYPAFGTTHAKGKSVLAAGRKESRSGAVIFSISLIL